MRSTPAVFRSRVIALALVPLLLGGAGRRDPYGCTVTLNSYGDGHTRWTLHTLGGEADTWTISTQCFLAISCTGVTPTSVSLDDYGSRAGIDGTYTWTGGNIKGVMTLTATGVHSECSASRSIFQSL